MSVVDVMRVRLARATELGVPSREFLRHEYQDSLALKCHVSSRVAQAGQEIEDAVRQLEVELESSERAALSPAAWRLLRGSDDALSPVPTSGEADRPAAGG